MQIGRATPLYCSFNSSKVQLEPLCDKMCNLFIFNGVYYLLFNNISLKNVDI